MQEVADEEYVRRFRAGDAGAFEQLVVRYEARLRRMAFGFVREAHLAEDIAQDTFLQAYRRLDKLQNPASFRSWLFSIGLNRSRDELRRLAKLSDATDLEEPLRRLRSPPSTERLLESRELGRWLASLVADLPDAQRVALLLKEVSGMTYSEIAQLLEIPIGTVQIRVHRGRLRLRERLRELGWRDRADESEREKDQREKRQKEKRDGL